MGPPLVDGEIGLLELVDQVCERWPSHLRSGLLEIRGYIKKGIKQKRVVRSKMSFTKKETNGKNSKSSSTSQSNPPSTSPCAPNAAGICIPKIHMQQQQQPPKPELKPPQKPSVQTRKGTAAKPEDFAREIPIQYGADG